MKVLAIGNSFSQDATRYIHDIAKADGVDFKVVNLVIGGCPLKKHYLNALEDLKAYSMEFNGYATGFSVSIKEALMSDEWDYVTLQQASHFSFNYETYKPYLEFMKGYINKYCPHAKIVIHQTWAYEDGSDKLNSVQYDSAKKMLEDLTKAYQKAAKAIDAEFIIPCGLAMMKALESGVAPIHRDTFHAKRGAGRYLLGLVWYKYFTKNSVIDNTFCEFDEEVSVEDIAKLKKIAEEI